MTRRLPRAAQATAAAALPPHGLDGLDPAHSRLVEVAESPSGRVRGWHVLDTGPALDERGVRPVGTVLCVHGNPTWSYLWRRLVAASLEQADVGAPAWRVVAVDQLDMGYSERTGERRPLARRVRDLADLTAALGLGGPVVTLGHDWGGVVSLGWAVDHPALLAGVLLLNTAVHHPGAAPIPWPLRVALASGVLGPATVGTPAFLETTLALARPRLGRAVADGYRAPYRGAVRRGGIGGFVADIPVDAGHDSRAELDRIAAGVAALRVPALLQWGPEDPIFDDRYLQDLIERMPHAEVHRHEGAGHLLAEDVDYATPVLDWLAESGAGGAAPRPEEPVGTAVRDLVAADRPSPAHEGRFAATKGLRAAAEHRCLWAHLDERRDDTTTALAEMAPPGGGGPREVSWALLSLRVRQLAAGLTELGVRRGDRVSLLVPPGATLTAVLYACLRIGAIVVVADAGLGLRGLTRAVRGARPRYLVGGPTALAAARVLRWNGIRIATTRISGTLGGAALGVEAALGDLVEAGAGAPTGDVDDARLPAAPEPDDTAAVLFTSGSTGPAKGVVYTHRQLSALAATLGAQYGIGPGTGLVAGFAPFALLGPALGARSATPDMDVTAPRTLTAAAVADAVRAVRGTTLFLSPAAIANVVATAPALTDAQRGDLGRVELFLSAGAPVPERLLAAAAELMPRARAHTPYGMTEGLLMTDASLDDIRAAGHPERGGVLVGRPVGGVEVRISALDDAGDATGAPSAESDVTGEVVVSAPHLKEGYDRLARTDREARRGAPPAAPGVRWHRTGDVGRLDDAGRLWIEGRAPHVIRSATGPVTPVGVEQRVDAVAGVARSAAVGVGPAGTQQVVAVIERDPPGRAGLATPALASAARAAAPVPLAAVLVVRRLPVDIRHNSKIDRGRLARWASAVLAGARMAEP